MIKLKNSRDEMKRGGSTTNTANFESLNLWLLHLQDSLSQHIKYYYTAQMKLIMFFFFFFVLVSSCGGCSDYAPERELNG